MKSPHDGPFRLTPDEVVEFAKLLAISTHAFAGCTLTPDEAVEFAKLPTLDEWLEQRVEVIRPLPTLDDRLGQRVEAGIVLLPILSLDKLLTVLGCFVRNLLTPNNPDTRDQLNLGRMECLRYFMVHRNGSAWIDDLAERLTMPKGSKPVWWYDPVCKDAFKKITVILRKSTLGNWPPEKADLERLEKLRQTVQDSACQLPLVGVPGDAAAHVASVALSSPPWSKKIAPAVEKCLLAYRDEKIVKFASETSYKKDPCRLALLVRAQIVKAMKSEKSPFVPLKGRWPVGRTAGKVKLITFDGDENPTKNGRKPRES